MSKNKERQEAVVKKQEEHVKVPSHKRENSWKREVFLCTNLDMIDVQMLCLMSI